MDDPAEKRPVGVLEFSRRSSSLSFREPKHAEKNFHYCNRTKDNSRKNTENSSSEKLKYFEPHSRSKAACSSRLLSSSFCERQNRINLETNVSECNQIQGENEDGAKFDLEFRRRNKGLKKPILDSFPSRKYGKQISQGSSSATQVNTNTPFRQSLIPRIAGQMPKSISQCAISRPQRKKFHHGEGSSCGTPLLQVPEDNPINTKTQCKIRDAANFVKTNSSSRGESSRMRQNEEENEHILQLPEQILCPMRSNAPLTISEAVDERSPLPFDLQNDSFAGRSRSRNRSSRHRSVSHIENGDDHIGLNMERIAEVLRALERIEIDEVFSHEQLMVLEANLFEGFSFFDQHRDMRLDIDNMSYEDLLALEEKIGSVSTALPEAALSKCLKKSIYTSFLQWPVISGHGDDDFKCCICQEGYLIGEELGQLPCKHHYHMACIQQWLRLKNWCPICKAPALS